MKIKQLIESEDIEPHYSTETLINVIKERCSQFVDEFGSYPPIMRLDNKVNGYDIKNTQEVREPISFLFRNPTFNREFNKLLREYGHNDRVHNVVFGSSIKNAKNILMGDSHYLIPIDGYSYTYSDKTGSDFNYDNPLEDVLLAVVNILNDNYEEFFEVLTEERDEIIKNLSDEQDDLKRQIHDIYSNLLQVSDKIDRDPFDESLEKDYKNLVQQYNSIEYLKEGDFINIKNIIHGDLEQLVRHGDTIKKFIEDHFYTDTIKDSLFSESREIYFKTNDYILVDPQIIDYNELMNKAR